MRRRLKYKRKRRYIIKRRRISRRPTKKVETKIYTVNIQSQAIYATHAASATANSAGAWLLTTDLLSNIVPGTAANQRIGSKIFVKKIQMLHTVYLCPLGNSAQINHATVRYVIGSFGWQQSAGTPFSDFFDAPVNVTINGSMNRRKYMINKDKTYVIASGWPAPNDAAGLLNTGQGMTKVIRHTLNLNRSITYMPGSNQVKDERNSINLACFGYLAGQPAGTETRCACQATRYRVWYTDD